LPTDYRPNCSCLSVIASLIILKPNEGIDGIPDKGIKMDQLNIGSFSGFKWRIIMNRHSYPTAMRSIAVFVACLLLLGISQAGFAANNWQSERNAFAARSAAYSGSVYVVAAENGIWRSTDGSNWIKIQLPTDAGASYQDAIWDGSQFIAVGRGVITSSDGRTWTTRYQPDNAYVLIGVIEAGGVYVAVGTDGDFVLRSSDGQTWAQVSTGLVDSSTTSYYLNGVTSDGSQFVAVGSANTPSTYVCQNDVVVTSSDGLTWSSGALPNSGTDCIASTGLNGAAWGNSTFVIGGWNGVYTSPDGTTWSERTTGGSNFWPFNGIQFLNGEFVATGVGTLNSTSSSSVNDYYSTDGVTWQGSSITTYYGEMSSYSVSSMLYINSKYLLFGYLGTYASTDLSSWASGYVAPSFAFSQCLVAGSNSFSIFGSNGTLYSKDGVTWSYQNVNKGAYVNNGQSCGAFGAGVYVLAAYSIRGLYWSTDGVTFTYPTLPIVINGVSGVIWNGNEFVALADAGATKVLTSTDGKNWAVANTTGLPSSATLGTNYGGGLAFAGQKYFAWGTSSGSAFLLVSADAKSWAPASTKISSTDSIEAIAYGLNKYVLIGNHADGSTFVESSSDGTTWSAETVSSSVDGIWYNLVWDGGEFLAAGGTPGFTSAFLTSSDGTSWSETTDNATTEIYGLATDGTQAIAASYYDVLQKTSPVLSSSSPSSGGGSSTGGSSSGKSSSTTSGSGGGALGLLGLTILLVELRRKRRTQ
jgi:hypothetical protein